MIDDYTVFSLNCSVLYKQRPLLILKRTLYALLANNARETFALAHILLRKIKGIIWVKIFSFFRLYGVLAREMNKFQRISTAKLDTAVMFTDGQQLRGVIEGHAGL